MRLFSVLIALFWALTTSAQISKIDINTNSTGTIGYSALCEYVAYKNTTLKRLDNPEIVRDGSYNSPSIRYDEDDDCIIYTYTPHIKEDAVYINPIIKVYIFDENVKVECLNTYNLESKDRVKESSKSYKSVLTTFCEEMRLEIIKK